MEDTQVVEQSRSRLFFRQVYALLTVGIIFTGLVSLFVLIAFPTFLVSLMTSTWWFIGIFVAQLAVLFVINGLRTTNKVLGTVVFLLFTGLEGVILSPLVLIYDIKTIVLALGSALALFAIMAIIGYTTHADLSSWRGILLGTTLAILAVGILNLFMHSSMISFLISVVVIVVFSGWSMYDSQKLKYVAEQVDDQNRFGYVVCGASDFYLDILNLFVALLRIYSR